MTSRVATVAFQGTSGGSDPAPQVVQITNAGGGVLRGLAVSSIVYDQPSSAGWLRAALSLENAGARVSLTASPVGLPVGNYSAKVIISSTSLAVVPREFNVTFAVASPPILTLSSAIVSFGASVGGVLPPTQSIDVTNTGGGTLSSLAVSAPISSGGQPATWLTATLSSTSAPSTITFAVDQVGLSIGTYLASVGVSSAGATGSPRTLAVTLVVSQNALIIASPTSVSFAAVLGTSPAPASISITNGGGGSLTGLSLGATQYGAGQPTNWLVATLGAAQAPSQITITPSTSALPVGTYSASFAVQSSQSGVSDAAVTVNLTVRSAAAIVLTTTNVTLTASKTSANPSAVVGITNGGSGALAGLSAVTTYVVPQGTSWLSTSFAGATTAPTSLTLQPTNLASLAVGTYTATVRVSSPSAPAFVDIAVTLNVLGSLKAGSSTLALFGPFGVGTSVAEFTSIANDGIGFVDGLATSVTYTSGSGWLANRLSQTKTPATLFAEANPAPTAPRGISLATVTVRGNNVLPITVIISREIGYTFERHVVTTTSNLFNSLGCYGCHDTFSANPIPFTDYVALVSLGYFNPASRTPGPTSLYSVITGGGHSGGTYPPSTYPAVALLRDWISDGSRQR